MKLFEILRIIFSSTARHEKKEEAKAISAEVRQAAKEHSREVALLREALSEGPRLKLVVEPPRRRNGQFAPCTSRSH